jgi:ribonuclease Z
MRLLVLGSSSARPTRARHLSATLVSTDNDSLLIDCGEGTQFQLLRAKAKTARIRSILITHLHGDHLFGLPGLLGSFAMDQRTDPIHICGPAGIRRFVEFFSDDQFGRLTFPIEITEIHVSDLSPTHPSPLGSAGTMTIAVGPLKHRVDTVGYRITTTDEGIHFDVAAARAAGIAGPKFGELAAQGWTEVHGTRVELSAVTLPPRPPRSIAVFGDTRPCDSGVVLAQGVDLLVHEATYANEEQGLAEAYLHSTAAEAAGVARAAGVGRLILNHFSPRYPDVGCLVSEARSVFPATSAAEELVWVNV